MLFACGRESSVIGAACTQDSACTSPARCASAELPGGSCTFDCSERACPDGSQCSLVKDRSFCTRSCTTGDECRPGYQCENGGCVPACTVDAECGRGFRC